jgi:hypothetical protein
LAADGSTYVSLPAVLKLTANGCIGSYAAAGQFELVVTTATGLYVNVANVAAELSGDEVPPHLLRLCEHSDESCTVFHSFTLRALNSHA